MKKITVKAYEEKLNHNTYQWMVYSVLKDKKWHCRSCSYKDISSEQLAGGGGIQGLQRGTKNRPGLVIVTKQDRCNNCNCQKTFDKWTGEFKKSTAASNLPTKLANRILAYYHYIDSIEQRTRQASELVIDHRFPMERYGDIEDENPVDMPEEQIQEKFQLLKKDSSGNHNLLKSRACEKCMKTGQRGSFLGIDFFYQGNIRWPDDCPQIGEDAKKGCIGCGWYDINKWRDELNIFIENNKKE
ncbi:hypothetical protein [Butyrivibrio sp. VCB2001]|uniref:hypothetical protein n=1 Tax=Butyrivibrio sp. VCB2001 TaxID=1280667 RepID=UPI000416DB1F|nr:hypothetical protein [Butyrivibrio sp. VCB2001]